MNNALLHHALDNIWCNPEQDKQFVWKLVHLTPRGSVQHHYTSFYEKIVLPDQKHRYHVYQIGKMYPSILGLPTKLRTWMSLGYLMNEHLTYCDVYTLDGIQQPHGDSWVWFTPSGNMLFAVKDNRRVKDLFGETVYFRCYSNAFFDSPRGNGFREIIHRQLVVTDNNVLLRFQRELRELVEEKGGFPFYYVNGRFVNNVSLVTAGEDDVCEFILDRSIKKMVTFDITEQPVFHSTKDAVNKYLLHPPQIEGEDRIIDYVDDVEAYVVDPFGADRFTGVVYPRNHRHWLRQVTHRDYSAPVSSFVELAAIHPTDPRHQINPTKWREDRWRTPVGKQLRLYIRDAGYHRPLVPVANRIMELYRLPSRQILRAMLETDGTVSAWTAANLEASNYTTLMGMRGKDIMPMNFNDPTKPTAEKQALEELVGNAYGYHAAGYLLADTPSKVYLEDGVAWVDLAYEHQRDTTVFEYDQDGLLIDYYFHPLGTRWRVKNPSCQLVEAITGRGHFRVTTHEGTDPVGIPPGFNARIYVKRKEFNTVVGEWEDITFREDRHEWGFIDTTLGQWVWTKPSHEFHGGVRIDDEFLCYPLRLLRQDGHLRFTLERETRNVDGYWGSETLDIPYGQLDVFLNRHQLLEGVDYVVRYPEVVIHNLEYLTADNTQDLVIRMSGFAKDPTTRQPTSEVGFIKHRVLSTNDRYDLHTHKVQRIVVDGGLRHRDDVVFEEQVSNYVIDDARNGAPYMVQRPAVNFREVFDNDEVARQRDDVIDKEVSDYMTEHFALRPYTSPNYVPRKYQVISVFANKLLNDLMNGTFYPDGIEGNYSQHDIRRWCTAYEWLLPYDLGNQDYDTFHLNLRPHWHPRAVSIDMFKYRFFHRALETYLRNPPDLAPYIMIA